MIGVARRRYRKTGVSVIASDNFNRADNTTSLGTADTGQAWAVSSGTWGISSNTAYDTTSATAQTAQIEAGKADCTVSITYANNPNNAGGGSGLSCRVASSGNFYFVARDVAGKCVNGSLTVLASYTTAVALDVMSVTLSGSSLVVKKNGVQVGSFTDSTFPTQTLHGLWANSNNLTRFDNFSIA